MSEKTEKKATLQKFNFEERMAFYSKVPPHEDAGGEPKNTGKTISHLSERAKVFAESGKASFAVRLRVTRK